MGELILGVGAIVVSMAAAAIAAWQASEARKARKGADEAREATQRAADAAERQASAAEDALKLQRELSQGPAWVKKFEIGQRWAVLNNRNHALEVLSVRVSPEMTLKQINFEGRECGHYEPGDRFTFMYHKGDPYRPKKLTISWRYSDSSEPRSDVITL